MGLLGKGLNRLCDERPDLAQAVLDRPIGNLAAYIDDKGCGCVFGTVAMAAGFIHADEYQGSRNADGRFVMEFLGEALGWDPEYCDDLAVQVYAVSERIEHRPDAKWTQLTTARSDAITVHLIRQRIAVRLAMVGV